MKLVQHSEHGGDKPKPKHQSTHACINSIISTISIHISLSTPFKYISIIKIALLVCMFNDSVNLLQCVLQPSNP